MVASGSGDHRQPEPTLPGRVKPPDAGKPDLARPRGGWTAEPLTFEAKPETAGIEVVDPGTFYGIGPHESRFPCVPWQLALRKASVPMLVYWLSWRPQELVRPATVRVRWEQAAWSEPVVVDLLTGEVSEAQAAGSALEVPLADYPFVLTERTALELADTPQQPGHDEIVAKLRWTY